MRSHSSYFQLLILLCVTRVTRRTLPGSDIDVRNAIRTSYVKIVFGVVKFQGRTITITKRENIVASYVLSLFVYTETFIFCVI